MPAQDYKIRPFALRSASPNEYACLNTFENILRLEFLPDDPPVPCAEEVQRWQAMPEVIQEAAWAAWNESQDQILAFAGTDIYLTGDNPQRIDFRIEVLPERRRQGLGRQLLRLIADCARRQNRRLMLTESNDRVPASGEFLRRIGARPALEEPVNQLRLADLDRELILRWLEQASRRSAEFSLGLWDDVYPGERIQEMADLLQVVANDQPRDTLDIEDINFTPETVRQFERAQLAAGDQRWVLYLVDRHDNRIAGLTEVFWNPNRPNILNQGFTGVLPDHRNKGLGRWLKAAMISKILRERPEVDVIRTGNASSNAPMLRINQALGFRRYVSWVTWQVELDSVEKYLSAGA